MGFLLEKGALVAGKYRLESPIGRGGMAHVWSARHEKLDSRVAIKFIEPAFVDNEHARTRFVREARTAAKLTSRHVVNIHDYGVEDDTPYIIMEMLEGEELAKRLQKLRTLSLQDCASLVWQAAKGIQNAHDHGIVHRDLKPRNIFLSHDGADETVKILDFGVAKADWARGSDTKTGDLVGSPHYMSPEQVHGAKEVDHRSDLWSLGVIVFIMLTGERPFAGDGVGQVIVQISTKRPRRATEVNPELPAAIDGFFAVAFAHDPDERFQSAREMAEALRELAGSKVLNSLAFMSGEHPIPILPSPSDSGVVIVPSAPPPAPAVADLGTYDIRSPSYGSLASLHASLRPDARRKRSGIVLGVIAAIVLAAGVLLFVSSSDAPAPSGVPAAQPAPLPLSAPAPVAAPATDPSQAPASPSSSSSASVTRPPPGPARKKTDQPKPSDSQRRERLGY